MAINATCPQCGKKIKAPDSAAGKKGKCPACQAVFQVPDAAPTEADEYAAHHQPHDVQEDPAAALAAAIHTAAVEHTHPAEPSPPPAEDAAPPAEPVEPVPAKPVKPAKVQAAEPKPEPAAEEQEIALAPEADAETQDEELLPGMPVGVQTPSGLPARQRRGSAAFRWQRTLAGYVRIAGLVLGGLSLVFGIVAMIVMVVSQGGTWLLPGIGLFIVMLIVGAMSALGGLLARHMLLLLADLGEDVRHQDDLLDRMNDRLG
jgi:hypothetical protein